MSDNLVNFDRKCRRRQQIGPVSNVNRWVVFVVELLGALNKKGRVFPDQVYTIKRSDYLFKDKRERLWLSQWFPGKRVE